MSKKQIEKYLPDAYDALAEAGIAKNGKIEHGFRGQISAFGASVTMGSLAAAVAFFSNAAGADVERNRLMDAVYRVMQKQPGDEYHGKNLKDIVLSNPDSIPLRQMVLDIAVALKLAMNFYQLTKPEEEGTKHEK